MIVSPKTSILYNRAAVRLPCCVGWVRYLVRWGEAVGEFEGGDEARLLVQAAEAADGVDDLFFFLESFAGRSLNSPSTRH